MMLRQLRDFLFGTLRGRLILGVALVHAVMMAIFVIDLTIRQRAMLLEHQTGDATALALSLSTSAALWIEADDISGLQELVETQHRYPELLFALLADKHGRILAHTDETKVGLYLLDLPREAQLAIFGRTSALVDVAAPALLAGRHVGWARIGIGQQSAAAKLAEITRNGIVYALAAIVIGTAIAWFMGRRITRRLYIVQETIDAVRGGNSQARSLITGPDEAAGLAREFNAMLDNLAAREKALERLNRELRAISNCNQTLIRTEDEQTLLNEICRIVCDEAGYRMAWVGYAENDAAKTIRPVAWAGFDSGYIADVRLTWAEDAERGQEPGGMAIRNGENIYIQDIATDPRMAPWRDSALQRGYRSLKTLPLKDESAKVFGVFLIYAAEPDAIPPDEMRLLVELAGDLAFGITVLRARVKRKQVEEELRKLNQELEKRVQERTAELEAANRELEAFSYQDGLTGIVNRRLFDLQLEQECRRCGRRGSPLSLIMVDVDYFKNYNDTYGHLAGDECLKLVAAHIAGKARRAEDLVARDGGEEFVVLLPDTDIKVAGVVAEAMRAGVEALNLPHPASQAADRVTISLGVAGDIPWPQGKPHYLISAADLALYCSKTEGRNRVSIEVPSLEGSQSQRNSDRPSEEFSDLQIKPGETGDQDAR